MKLKRTLFPLLLCFILLLSSNIVMARTYFYDIYGHWAEDSIMWGANTVKLLNGYEDGSFEPDDNITRAEYVSLLYRTAKKQGVIKDSYGKSTISGILSVAEGENEVSKDISKEEPNYIDIDYSFWGYNDILEVMNFVNSKGNHIKFSNIFSGNRFFPNEKITREEATVLSYFFTSPPIHLKNITFTDITYNYKYYSQIKSMASNDTINGYTDGTFRPYKNITRAEAVTIIKKIFSDMEYQKNLYLDDIMFLEGTKYNTYPLFGKYTNRKLDSNDLLYKRAIETMEYKSLVGVIPFEERHLYDPKPIQTIEELKKNQYENIIGVNYYLIKYESKVYKDKNQLINEILTSFINGTEIQNDELQIIFNDFFSIADNMDLMLKALEYWDSIASDEDVSNNILFMKSKLYMLNKRENDAIQLYESINSTKINIRVLQLMNQSYILKTLNKYDDAEKVLRDGWEQIKVLDTYTSNRVKYDNQFISALKKILSLKNN